MASTSSNNVESRARSPRRRKVPARLVAAAPPARAGRDEEDDGSEEVEILSSDSDSDVSVWAPDEDEGTGGWWRKVKMNKASPAQKNKGKLPSTLAQIPSRPGPKSKKSTGGGTAAAATSGSNTGARPAPVKNNRPTPKSKTSKNVRAGGRQSATGGSNAAGPAPAKKSRPSPKTKNPKTEKPPTTKVKSKQDSSAPRKKTKKEGTQDSKMSEALECTICLDFPASPIYNCDNGHITCGTCYGKLMNKQCGLCKAGMHVSVFAERMAKKLEIKLPCENNTRGCKEKVISTDMAQHLRECYYRDIVCHEAENVLCYASKIPYEGFVTHLKDWHRKPFLLCDTNASKLDFSIQLIQNVNRTSTFADTSASRVAWHHGLKVIQMKEKHIFLHAFETRESMYLWCTMLGDKKEVSKCGYILKIISANKSKREVSITWKYPVLPYLDHPSPKGRGFTAPSASYASISIPSFIEFGKKENDKVVCDFSVEVKGV